MTPDQNIGLDAFYAATSTVFLCIRVYVLRHQFFGGGRRTLAPVVAHVSILVAYAVLVASSGVHIQMVRDGVNAVLRGEPIVPRWGVPLSQVDFVLKTLYATRVGYALSIFSVKAGFLAIYYDLGEFLPPWAQKLLRVSIAYTAVSFVVCFLTSVLWCFPVRTNWDQNDFCSAFRALSFVSINFVFNLTTDLLLLILAFSVIWTIQLRGRERYALHFVSLIGLISIIAGVIRFGFMVTSIHADPRKSGRYNDIVFAASEAEVFAAFIAVCLPALRVLLRRHSSDHNHDRNGNRNGRGSGNGNGSSSYFSSFGWKRSTRSGGGGGSSFTRSGGTKGGGTSESVVELRGVGYSRELTSVV